MAEQTVRAPTPSVEHPAPGRRLSGTRLTLLVGGLLAVAVLVIELLHLPLPSPMDHMNYFRSAERLPAGSSAIPVHQSVRLGLTIPMRLAIEVLGPTEAAYHAVPVLAGLSLALAVYALGVLLFSRAVGVAAALLTIGNNVIFFDLLQPLPDILATALFCWAMVLTIAVRQELPAVSSTRRRQIAALLAVGALLGWAYLTREYSVFAWPLVPALLARRVGWRSLLWVALPLAAVAVGELALGALVYDDPLARVRAVTGHGQGSAEDVAAVDATFKNKSRVWYLNRVLVGVGREPEGRLLLGVLAASLVGGVLIRKRLGVLLAWTAMVYVPLVLLGGLLDPSHPMLRLFLMRYWFQLFPAFILGGLGVAWWLARAGAERVPALRQHAGIVAGGAALLLAVAVLAPASTKWDRSVSYKVMGQEHLHEFDSWLRANDTAVRVIWSDRSTARLLPLYFREPFGSWAWDGQVKALRAGGPGPQPGDHIVLFNTKPTPQLCRHCRQQIERVLGRPAVADPNWQPVFATPDQQLLIYQAR